MSSIDNNNFATSTISRSVHCEVVETLYSGLAGAITNLCYVEENFANPDSKLIRYYDQICSALWHEKSLFSRLSYDEIVIVDNTLSPILMRLSGFDYEHDRDLILGNRNTFDNLISKLAENE